MTVICETATQFNFGYMHSGIIILNHEISAISIRSNWLIEQC